MFVRLIYTLEILLALVNSTIRVCVCVCRGSKGSSKLEEMRAEPGFPQAREIGFVPIMPVLNAVHALLSRKCCDSDLRSHGSRFART